MNKELKNQALCSNLAARRSQRRINKMLDKNISEYQIPNPYRNSRAHPYLPRNLTKQLSRMDVFSIRALQNLRFNQPTVRQQVNQLLSKMRGAVQRQSQEFTTYVTEIQKKMKKMSEITKSKKSQISSDSQDFNELNNSALIPKSNEYSIDLQGQNQLQENLPLVSHQSEGASMMSDNYETDKLIFPTGQYLLLHQIQEHQIQFYQN